jgi:hypothetical protein
LRPRKIARFLAALIALYLAAGYLTARLRWIDAEESAAGAGAGQLPLGPAAVRAAGALHVHTDRSHDALGSESEVARVARAAGLDFVILTDHRSAGAPAGLWDDAARFLDSVLLVRGQEVSLGGETGRVVVFPLDTALTRWDAGPAAFGDYLERSGGTAIVAHSRSPRVRDSWRPRATPGIVGWEVFDLADVGRARLAGPWVGYHALALLATAPFGRSHTSLLRLYREGFAQPHVAAFDSLRADRRLTALGGLDAHPKARIGGRLIPGYGMFLKSVVNHVELGQPLPEDPEAALAALAAALSTGAVFISFGETELARNFVLFIARPGDLPTGIGRPVALVPDLVLRAGFWGGPRDRLLYRVVRDGTSLAWVRGPELAWPIREPGLYRVEAYRYTLRVGSLVWDLRPWIFGNPNRVVAMPPPE